MRDLAAVILALVSGMSFAVEVQLSAEVQTPSRPTIQGVTNLPDGTKLAVIVSRKESAYRVETSTEVRSGGFLVGPLSQRGNELNPGLYKLEVAMVRAADQPLSVQQVIGRQGEKLRGPLPSLLSLLGLKIVAKQGGLRSVAHIAHSPSGLWPGTTQARRTGHYQHCFPQEGTAVAPCS